MTRFPRGSAPAIATVLLLTALPSTAGAATASLGDGSSGTGASVTYSASPGEANRLTVTETDAAVVFDDPAALIAAVPPCVLDGPSRASCPLPAAGSILGVFVGSGGSTATLLLSPAGRFRETYLAGGNGNDVLTGSDVADQIRGHGGDDTLNGGAGDDYVWGNAGNDTINPGLGADHVFGDEGDDTIDTRDTPPGWDPYDRAYEDRVLCGDGIDTLKPDYFDYLGSGSNGDCENVERPPDPPVDGPAPGGNNPPPPPASPLPFALANRVAKARGKTAQLSTRCAAQSASACDGSLRLMYGSKLVGQTARFRVQPGKTRVAAIKLSTLGRKLARRRGGAKVSVVAVPTGGSRKTIGSVKLVTR